MSATFSDDDGVLAGEYVLGVLEGAERQAVAARAAREEGLAAQIADWEDILAPLALLVPPVTPPAELWERLSRAIGATESDNVVILRAARRATTLWRGAAVAALALAACLAVVAILPRAPRPVSIAALAPLNRAAPAFIARVLPDGGLVIAAIAPDAVPAGRDLELWALPAGATRPVSLGVLPAAGARVAASQLTAPGGQLLVSIEPKGGSPTGLPTGPVVYGGKITPL